MKLDPNAIIAKAKITNYLLQWRPKADKSQFLRSAGYELQEAPLLIKDIREQLLPLDALFEESTAYGDKYQIRGRLRGPNGRVLRILSIWMVNGDTMLTKFLPFSQTGSHDNAIPAFYPSRS